MHKRISWFDFLVRDAGWITAARVAAGAPILLLSIIVGATFLVVVSPTVAGDFVSFWAASKLALAGTPALVYDPAAHLAAQKGLLQSGWAAFFYPPVFLLICLPLALLPFGVSATAWLVATGGFFVAAIRPYLPRVRGAMMIAAAYPAAWLNMASGQNGFLTAGLLGFGASWLDRRPILAGICFGCLAYKPQFAVVLPAALVFSGRWRVVITAAVTGAVLVGTSVAVLGVATWAAFFHESSVVRSIFERLGEGPGKQIGVMGALTSLGLPAYVGYGAQAVVTAAACIVFALILRRCDRPLAIGAALGACAALASPWLHRYDLQVLGAPIAWLATEGLRSGFRPWERITLLGAFVMPLFSGPLGLDLHLSVEVLVIGMLLLLLWRRLGADEVAV